MAKVILSVSITLFSSVATKNVSIISMKKQKSTQQSKINYGSVVVFSKQTLNGTIKAVYKSKNTITKSQPILILFPGITKQEAFLKFSSFWFSLF